jgi:hypothetical protein
VVAVSTTAWHSHKRTEVDEMLKGHGSRVYRWDLRRLDLFAIDLPGVMHDNYVSHGGMRQLAYGLQRDDIKRQG